MTDGNRQGQQSGFTLLEVLIAVTILLIATTGILSMHQSAMRATGFSRHASEASVLGEDKLEQLRVVPVTDLVAGTDTVNALGISDGTGIYVRAWTVVFVGTVAQVNIVVRWTEPGGDYTVSFATQRHI